MYEPALVDPSMSVACCSGGSAFPFAALTLERLRVWAMAMVLVESKLDDGTRQIQSPMKFKIPVPFMQWWFRDYMQMVSFKLFIATGVPVL